MVLKRSKYGLITLVLAGAITFLFCERAQSPLPKITPEISPVQGATTTTFKFDLSETFKSDLNNKIFVRWDWEGDSVFDTPFLHESILSHRYYTAGKYKPRAEIMDLSGQTAESSFQIDVISGYSTPRPVYKVSPETGNTYTTFIFDASMTQDDEDSLSTLLFKWDFEGDGVWDTELDHSYIVEHVFPDVQGYFPKVYVEDPSKRAGAYSQALRVTLLDTCIVPEFTSIRDSLVQNEESVFDASSSVYACDEGEQLWYRWDFNNDRFFDTEWLEDPVTIHVFPYEREYWVRLVVKNSKGLENSVTKRFWLHHQNKPPVARFTISTYGGNTKTKFRFDSWRGKDSDDAPSQLLNRWDFENDGIWDTELNYEKVLLHSFDSPGEYMVAMELIDRGGLKDTAYKTIYVNDSDYETGYLLDKRGLIWNHYGTIKIGDQWWFSKNLTVYHVRNYKSWVYDGPGANAGFYGYLYPFSKLPVVCPDGWRVPTQDDWETLFEALPTDNSFEELVLGGSSGFNAVFGGLNDFSKMPAGQGITQFGYYWSSTTPKELTSVSVWVLTFDKIKQKLLPGYNREDLYYSVRCVKEN